MQCIGGGQSKSWDELQLWASLFEDLNRFRDHDNWLRNFLIASSLNGKSTAKLSKLKTR
jgi:hypothetical protein